MPDSTPPSDRDCPRCRASSIPPHGVESAGPKHTKLLFHCEQCGHEWERIDPYRPDLGHGR